MNTLNHFRMLLPIMVLFAQSVYGQLTTAKDTVINGALKLYVYEEWEESSVEKFAHRSTDNIQQIDIGEYGQMPLPIRFQIDRVETFAVFVNADSTEMLLASQCHGHFKNRYNAFYISPINEENRYILSNPICVHTEYAHFVTGSGCRIGMTKDELLSIKGTGYVVMENGDWRYSYLSTLDDPEIVEWCTQTGKGDLFWEFIFDGEYVACIFIACFN